MEPGGCRHCPVLEFVLWSKDGGGGGAETRATRLGQLPSLDYDVAILFPQANQIRQCEECRAEFTRTLAVPDLWWSDYCRNSNGYFGCEDAAGDGGVVSGTRTWCRFLVKQVSSAGAAGAIDYGWYKLNVFTAWRRHARQTMVVVFDIPPSAKEAILHRLLRGLHVELLGDPFWMYARLLEEVVSLQDRAVWAVRDRVRATENQRLSEWPKPDYIYLHDMARHAIHVSETLDVATNTLDGILAHHRHSAHLLGSGARLGDASGWALASTANRLLFFQDMLRSLRVRAASNRERLQNEIELAFNLVAQCDARISLKIGRAAQADGAAMRTVAFVTLAFLPATFICAIFSMSFFDYDSSSGSWSVSGDFWRYWAVAVPVTVCTALLWLGWTKLSPTMPIGGAGETETIAGARARRLKMLGKLQAVFPTCRSYVQVVRGLRGGMEQRAL